MESLASRTPFLDWAEIEAAPCLPGSTGRARVNDPHPVARCPYCEVAVGVEDSIPRVVFGTQPDTPPCPHLAAAVVAFWAYAAPLERVADVNPMWGQVDSRILHDNGLSLPALRQVPRRQPSRGFDRASQWCLRSCGSVRGTSPGTTCPGRCPSRPPRAKFASQRPAQRRRSPPPAPAPAAAWPSSRRRRVLRGTPATTACRDSGIRRTISFTSAFSSKFTSSQCRASPLSGPSVDVSSAPNASARTNVGEADRSTQGSLLA